MTAFNWLEDQIDFICDCVDTIPSALPHLTISEWAELNVILPPGTPRPGRYSFDYTPYSRELCDELSPQSSTREVILCGGVQITKTTIAALGQAYYMDHAPKRVLFASASDGLIRKFRVDVLDPMIDAVRGLKDKFTTQSTTSNRKGFSEKEIEYPGGSWHAASSENEKKDFRQVTKQIVFGDEIDGWKRSTELEGKKWKLLMGRVAGFGLRYKVYAGSTPTSFEESEIWPLYLSGDQRRFYVECPHCRESQYLEWGTPETKHGIKFSKDEDGNLIEGSVYYSCKNKDCHEPILNHHKVWMFNPENGAHWEPTATPRVKHRKTYHISSLYAPIAAITWEQIAGHFVDAGGDSEALHTFLNLYLAEPWKQEGYKPKAEVLEESDNDGYHMGEIPDGVLYLTGGIDVQRGEKGSKKNAARLELSIVGYGIKNRKWVILHKKIYGDVENANSGAWQSLREYWQENDGVFYRKRDGKAFNVKRIGVDSGYAKDVVYAFCQFARGFVPVRGVDARVKVKNYGKRLITFGFYLIEVLGEYYKGRIYRSLDGMEKKKTGPEDSFHISFPMEFGKVGDVKDYFKQITAEEMHPETGEFSNPSGSRNEALDCMVYADAVSDAWLDDRMEQIRARFKKEGATKQQLEKIDRKWVIMQLERKGGASALDTTEKTLTNQ